MKYSVGKLIPGIEIKCSYKKRTIEVLGYKIDTQKMNEFMQNFYKDKTKESLQIKYFNLLYDKCLQMGLTLSKKEEILWNPKNDWASVTIYSDLKKYDDNKNKMPEDMWEKLSAFNRKYCNDPKHILYIDKSGDYPSFQQTIEAIKSCNGVVFMPHLFAYGWVEEKEQFIKDIVNHYDIDGLECYYSDFTEEQTKFMLNLCDEKHLYKSGGSDYHGRNKAKIEMAVRIW